MLGHRKLDAKDYISILKRRWWIIAIPAVILPAIAYASTFFIPPKYLSKTLVIIETQKVASEYVKPIVANDLDQRLASMSTRIFSRSSLMPIIDRYNLYSKQHLTPDEKLELISKNISVKPVKSEIPGARGMPGFNITYENSDPNTAMLVCKDVTSLFINENVKSQEDAVEETTGFLTSQLAAAKKNLDDQDAKVAAFQRQYVGALPGEESTNVNMLTSINTQLQAVTEALTRMEQEKSMAEAMLAQQQSANNVVNFPSTPLPAVTTPAAQTPQQLELQSLVAQEAQLTEHYQPDYPDVVQIRRKIADLRKEIARTPVAPTVASSQAAAGQERTPSSAGVQQLQNQLHAMEIGIDQKKRQQAQLQATMGTYQAKISSSPLVEQQYKELTRDYETTLNTYNRLLAETERAKQSTDLQRREEGEGFRIMDAASLPDSPTFPDPIKFTVGGLAAGLMFGLGIVAMLEYKDTAVANERDIWEFTRLPTLAVIAYIPRDLELPQKRSLFARLNPFSRKQPVAQS
jgi:polysaccharide chain length determinant protein (PEP-CTERM system associated)